MKRNGDWMQTFTGRQFWPMDPKIEDIDILDIAHGLSNICRYGGHAKAFYSVAEHSCHVSDALPPELALAGLLDDAAEAYIGDMIRPIKYSIPQYQALDGYLSAMINERFGIPKERHPEVIRVDNAILADESEQVMLGQVADWKLTEPALGVTIQFWSPELAKMMFWGRFKQLYRG